MLQRLPRPSRATSSLTGALGALLLRLSLWITTEETPFPGVATLLPVVGTLLLIHAGGHLGSPTSRFLSSLPTVRVGDWSYSLYLWHWPFIAFAGLLWPDRPLAVVLAAAASVAPAVASYRWVEGPIRRQPFSRPRLVAVVAGTLAVPLVVAATVGYATANGYWNTRIHALQASGAPHAVGGCQSSDGTFCRWNAEAAGTPSYLVGDSHAGQFSDAVIAAATALDSPVSVAMAYSCPFSTGLTVALAGEDSGCTAHNDDVLARLTGSPAGTVVVTGADNYWSDTTWQAGLTTQAPSSAAGPKLAAWETALTRTLERLRRSGHAVVVVQTIPLHHGYDPARCSALAISADGCSHDVPVGSALREQGPAQEVIGRVSARTGARDVDLWDFCCSDLTCMARHDGAALYRNWSHISVSASRALAGRFAQVVAQSGADRMTPAARTSLAPQPAEPLAPPHRHTAAAARAGAPSKPPS